jgi:DNA-binding NarL/FixJ family response regulator
MESEAGRETPIRIILVEDHDLFRRGLRDLLEQEGIEVVGEAGDGTTAVELVEDAAPDVVVMDINMPGMSGIEATREIMRRSPATRILMLSVYEDEESVAEAIVAGACGYLLKDSAVEDIPDGVRAAARGEGKLSPRIAAQILDRLRGTESAGDLPASERPKLTDRELQVLRLMAAGKDNPEIAAELFISQQTVKNHVSNVLAKLQIDNRIQAAVYAVRRGMV